MTRITYEFTDDTLVERLWFWIYGTFVQISRYNKKDRCVDVWIENRPHHMTLAQVNDFLWDKFG